VCSSDLRKSPLVVIGLGKLGGREINYGSDLDLIFVANPNAKNLPALQRLAVDVMELLASPTELGVAFPTDARLRPDGEKGLLVNTLPAYEEYYRRRAQLWEIQALTRTRPIAGDLELGAEFQRLAAALTDFQPENVAAQFRLAPETRSRQPSASLRRRLQASGSAGRAGLAAYCPDWKSAIAHMRGRIEKERTPAGQDALAIKTGVGGLMDAEFIAQTLCLAHGWQEANTLAALQRARDTGALESADAGLLLDNFRQLRRVEGILRRWSFEGETVLPVDPAPYYRVAVRCGFATPEAFREAVGGWRRAIRQVYEKVFGK
jgi:glutamate-ammonia-ligase adenylyltransferase